MSHNSNVTRSGNPDSLPSWVSNHLGEGSPYMTDEVNQSPSLPMEGSPEESPLVAVHPSVEEKTNIMTLEELDALRDTYSFPSGVQIRLPDEGETLLLPAQERLILQFHNICPAQLVPNAWRSIACSMALWRVYKYSISLSEFRNLFSLNCNPKPNQGWLYFKARNKKVLLGGYPSNVKGWKSKFFFVSGDEWEIPEGASRVGAPRVPRTWGIPDKHCNNPPRLYDDEPKVFEEIFQSVEKSGRFSVPVLLDLKSFGRVFGSPGSRASRTAGDNLPSGEVPSSSSDVGESKNPMNKLGKKALPETIQSSLCRRGLASKRLARSLGRRRVRARGLLIPTKGVIIGEKWPGESITSSPSKKGKVDDGPKGKGVVIGPKGKKKATSSGKAPTPPATASPRPGEGSSANLGTVLGPTASMLGSPSVAEKLLRGVIPPADKEKVEKLTLDQTVTKLFHVIGQLREALNKSKEFAEEFKSSSEFMVAVEDSASKYFGERFNFCKVQLRRHHPDLTIDLEGTVVDQDLLAEQDEADEENDKEKTGENEGGN
ncbi:hypothetical protein Acr_25g0001950 [Actinidia rufa]|uniref:Uncharacterized protein n=1 Tax=Actinidia rufa TaxID=165716 RepID=A0A7J0GYA5_9ERIC|nr:hypothetical protein Acr_25g0001950 [Actinidia rufa]